VRDHPVIAQSVRALASATSGRGTTVTLLVNDVVVQFQDHLGDFRSSASVPAQRGEMMSAVLSVEMDRIHEPTPKVVVWFGSESESESESGLSLGVPARQEREQNHAQQPEGLAGEGVFMGSGFVTFQRA